MRRLAIGSWSAESDRIAFVELLFVLDGDPFKCSHAILPSDPPGLRWAVFGNRRAIFQFDPSKDEIIVLACE